MSRLVKGFAERMKKRSAESASAPAAQAEDSGPSGKRRRQSPRADTEVEVVILDAPEASLPGPDSTQGELPETGLQASALTNSAHPEERPAELDRPEGGLLESQSVAPSRVPSIIVLNRVAPAAPQPAGPVPPVPSAEAVAHTLSRYPLFGPALLPVRNMGDLYPINRRIEVQAGTEAYSARLPFTLPADSNRRVLATAMSMRNFSFAETAESAVTAIRNLSRMNRELVGRLEEADSIRLYASQAAEKQVGLEDALKLAKEEAVDCRKRAEVGAGLLAAAELGRDAALAQVAEAREVAAAVMAEKDALQAKLVQAETERDEATSSLAEAEGHSAMLLIELGEMETRAEWVEKAADAEKTELEEEYHKGLEQIFRYGYGCCLFKHNIKNDRPEIPSGMPGSDDPLPDDFFNDPRFPLAETSPTTCVAVEAEASTASGHPGEGDQALDVGDAPPTQ